MRQATHSNTLITFILVAGEDLYTTETELITLASSSALISSIMSPENIHTALGGALLNHTIRYLSRFRED